MNSSSTDEGAGKSKLKLLNRLVIILSTKRDRVTLNIPTRSMILVFKLMTIMHNYLIFSVDTGMHNKIVICTYFDCTTWRSQYQRSLCKSAIAKDGNTHD